MSSVAPTSREPTPDEVANWIKRRFWYFALAIVVLNVLVGALGVPLLNYMSKEYINTLLAEQKKLIDEAKAQAFSARQDSQTALEKATEAGFIARDVNLKTKELKSEATDISNQLNEYKRDAMERLPTLKQEIETAILSLGEYKKLESDITLIRDSEQLNTKVVWQSRTLKNNEVNKEAVFDFGKEVIEADAWVGTVHWHQELARIGDIKFAAVKLKHDGNRVNVSTGSQLISTEPYSTEAFTVFVIARVKMK